MMTIQAIETVYNGYKFRSRLEARWAVFFDTLGIKYEYEKEGFDLGDLGLYLPDFWLPAFQMWVEIKPSIDNKNDEVAENKIRKLYHETGSPSILFYGSPKESHGYLFCSELHESGGGDEETRAVFAYGEEGVYLLVLDETEDRYYGDINFNSTGLIVNVPNSERFHKAFLYDTLCSRHQKEETYIISREGCSFNSVTTKAAITARQARFEHGEKG